MTQSDPALVLVEPWFGESHATLINGIAKHSKIECHKITLPAAKWKWRMRMGALALSDELDKLEQWPDVFLFSDYVNLPSLMGFTPRLTQTPSILYFHENQLTYPMRKGKKRDFEFCAINVLSCLIATKCMFCTRQQMESFLDGIEGFLKHDDTIDPVSVITQIEDKSTVIPVGIDKAPFDRARANRKNRKGKPLRVVWPHRFEHDKNPDDFFSVLLELADEGLLFEIIACGRTYGDIPPIMIEAKEKLGSRIIQWGFLERAKYAEALASSDVVVSTAYQETQGLAVIEAILSGCDPLLPNRLSYPEIIGDELCKDHLYQNKSELKRRLRCMMRNPDRVRATSNHHAEMERFCWSNVAPKFDEIVLELIDYRSKNPL